MSILYRFCIDCDPGSLLRGDAFRGRLAGNVWAAGFSCYYTEWVPSFTQSVEIEASVASVFDFHEREDALSVLASRFPPVRLISKTPGIEVGTRVVLRIGPIRWVALHTAYEKNRFFVDEQIKGPFARWVHRHEFEAVGNGTRLTDRINYRLPGGSIVNALLGWLPYLGLKQMFAHRHAVTRSICEEKSKPVAR